MSYLINYEALTAPIVAKLESVARVMSLVGSPVYYLGQWVGYLSPCSHIDELEVGRIDPHGSVCFERDEEGVCLIRHHCEPGTLRNLPSYGVKANMRSLTVNTNQPIYTEV